MKVVFFNTDYTSLASIFISIITRSPYSHSAVVVGGQIYDASEVRGYVWFGKRLSDYGSRQVAIYDVGAPDTAATQEEVLRWVNAQMGRKYDWLGVFGWLAGVEDSSKVYCHEWVLEVLSKKLNIPYAPIKRLKAKAILSVMGNPQPIYVGEAKGYNHG